MEITKPYKVGNYWTNLIENSTGESVNFEETAVWYDGTPMDDAKVDGEVFRKLPASAGGGYVKMAFDTGAPTALVLDSVAELRAITRKNILLLLLGKYAKVSTRGYYASGDGGESDYVIYSGAIADDGFKIISPTIADYSIHFEPLLSERINVKIGGVTDDGVTDNSALLNNIFSKIEEGTTVVFPNTGGKYLIAAQTNIGKSRITVDVNNAEILNGIPDPRGTTVSLFAAAGSVSSVTTTSVSYTPGDRTISVASAVGLSVGDVVAFQGDVSTRNLSVIVEIVGTVLTLDRPFSNPITGGNTVYKVMPIVNTSVINARISFNGLYGYGVWITYGKNCRVENIRAKDIGSKVVQFSGSVDCEISNVDCDKGFDVAGDGGHSYVVRVATSNDITISGVSGSSVRHVVDFSGASRNVATNCRGRYNYSADFLTHSNNCKDNRFIDCESLFNRTCAYAFDPANGDTGNSAQGGHVEGSSLLIFTQDGSNSFGRITIKTTGNPYIIPINSGIVTLSECTLIIAVGSCLPPNLTDSSIVSFRSCRIVANIYRAIGNFTGAPRVRFLDCDFEVYGFTTGFPVVLDSTGALGVMNIDLINTRIRVIGDSATNFYIIGAGNINSRGSIYECTGAGQYVFGMRSSRLTADGNTFQNFSLLSRRLTTGDCSHTLGTNTVIGGSAGFYSFANTVNNQTIGMANISANTVPANVWDAGSKVLSGGTLTNAGWVYNGTTWTAF